MFPHMKFKLTNRFVNFILSRRLMELYLYLKFSESIINHPNVLFIIFLKINVFCVGLQYLTKGRSRYNVLTFRAGNG